MKRLGKLQMNTWIRGLLTGVLCALGSVFTGMGIVANIYGQAYWQLFGWALLAATPFLLIFMVVLIWMPYKNRGKVVKDEPAHNQ